MRKYDREEYELLEKLSKYPMSTFMLLGFITNYYAGTYNPSQEILHKQFIYDGASPLVYNREEYLVTICQKVIQDNQLDDDIKIEPTKDDFNKTSGTCVFSKSICNYLDSIGYEDIYLGKKDLDIFFIGLVKPPFGTYPTGLLQRLSFLVGSYLNHQSSVKGEFRLANNYKKVNLIRTFISDLAEEDDILEHISRFRTPYTHQLKINTDGSLWSLIEEQISILKNEQTK